MGRSLRLSEQGRTKADKALQNYQGGKATLQRKTSLGRTTIHNFFSRKAIDIDNFRALCFQLRLSIEEVAEKQSDYIDATRNSGTGIDELVQQVRSRCCDKILQEHSRMRLLTREEVAVDRLYVDVWVLERLSVNVYTTIPNLLKYFDPRRDRLCLGRQMNRRGGVQVAEQFSRLLVLGKPGAGKTTFLKHLAVNCCQGEFYGGLVPVFLELRSIQTDTFDLFQEIQQAFELSEQSQTATLLQHGKVLVILDGLDEVPNQWRRQVQNQIRDVARKYHQNRFILTCRTQIIECPPENFECVEVADFNPEQVRQFVENWFSAKTSAQGAEKARGLLQQLENNKPIRELAITPILLSLTCCFFDDIGELPTQRSQLYRRGLNQLLKEWDKGRDIQREVGNAVYQQLTVSQKEQLLSVIAAHKFEQANNFVLFDQPEIARCIADRLNLAAEDGEAVLEAIEAQHGLLVERANEIWSFSHLTFQEYFTAYYYVQSQNLPILASRVFDSRWREVFVLVVEMLQPAEHLLKLMKQHIDQSIAQDVKLQQFLIWVREKAASVSAPYKPAAIRAYYLALALALVLALALDLDRTLDLDRDLTFDRDRDRDLDLDLNLARALDRTLDRALDCALAIGTPNLSQKLQALKETLQEGISQDFQQWWQIHGTTWTAQLQAAMIRHRNIGHDWQFSEAQKQLLQRYYDANKLLVDCLKISYPDDHPLRQKIESTLLLPISTMEQP